MGPGSQSVDKLSIIYQHREGFYDIPQYPHSHLQDFST